MINLNESLKNENEQKKVPLETEKSISQESDLLNGNEEVDNIIVSKEHSPSIANNIKKRGKADAISQQGKDKYEANKQAEDIIETSDKISDETNETMELNNEIKTKSIKFRKKRGRPKKNSAKELDTNLYVKNIYEGDKFTIEYYIWLLNRHDNDCTQISPFRKLKFSFPILRGKLMENDVIPKKSISECFGNQEPIPEKKKENLGYFNGYPIDITSKFQNESFIGHNFHRPIGSIDSTEKYIVLGTKLSLDPFDIFEKKDGPSNIIVLDKNCNLFKIFDFIHGDIIKVRIIHKTIFSLFKNGTLIKFSDFDLNSVFHYPSPINKIIGFDTDGTDLYYLDGSTVYSDKNQIIRSHDMLLINLICCNNKIYVMNVVGRIYEIEKNFAGFRLVFFKMNNFRMTTVNDYLIAYNENLKNHDIYPNENKKEEFLYYFFGLFNGLIVNCKRYRTKTRFKKFFQVRKKDNCYFFVDSEEDFDENAHCFIPGIKTYKNYLIFCTEDGLVMKVFFT